MAGTLRKPSGIVPFAKLTDAPQRLSTPYLDVLLLIGLILLNGLFAMSEIALVSARKIRLEQFALHGDKGAKAALMLASEPTRLLSTVQTGITLVTLAMGAFGESAFTTPLEHWFGQWSWGLA